MNLSTFPSDDAPCVGLIVGAGIMDVAQNFEDMTLQIVDVIARWTRLRAHSENLAHLAATHIIRFRVHF